MLQLNFHYDDDIRVGDYIHSWKTTQKNRLNQRSKLEWMYIDRIIKNAVEDDDPTTSYTTLALQVSDADLSYFPVLDKSKFATLIESGEFNKLRDIQDGPWKTDLDLSRRFLNELFR